MAEDRVTVITNGVEHDLFGLVDSLRPPPREAPRLIFTGNLASYQGIDHLLKAFKRVIQQRASARLLLVTESSFEPYEKLAAELGIRKQIDFSAAPFPEHPALLATAAIAVNPRMDCDGIQQKLLNYMAPACPTVSLAGSAPCIEHGETGWVVENGDIDAFGDAVVKLLDDPVLARRLGRRARDTVNARYTWDAAAQLAESVYHRLLRGDRFKRGRSLPSS
jgi:glycosyltransferase involved in cell wall biosynthesis